MIVFVADIHLDPHDASGLAVFEAWLRTRLARAEQVYILGDLFNYWYSGLETECASLLACLRAARVSLLSGNRDFLLTNTTGLNLIAAEEFPVELDGRRLILAHGHSLTRADYGFKCMHALVWPLFRWLDRRLPLRIKDGLARRMVHASRAGQLAGAEIAPAALRRLGADLVICGHLHRKIVEPGLIVLPAFVDAGEYLVYADGAWRFEV